MSDHTFFSSLIRQIADLLRGPYRPPQYERVMLPMTVLRRFDCVLASSKASVLAEHARRRGDKLEGEALDRRLNTMAGQRFHNLNSPWWNPALHREWRGARLTRREEGAYWAYATDEQRSQAGCVATRMQWELSPRAVKLAKRRAALVDAATTCQLDMKTSRAAPSTPSFSTLGKRVLP